LPPGSGSATGPDGRTLKYSADTNITPKGREIKVTLGDSDLTIMQERGPQPPMGFSPARLEFSPKTGSEDTGLSKAIVVGSSLPLVFTAKAENAPWLTIKPERDVTTPTQQQKFVVTVHTDQLKPGVYKANISLEGDGASNPKEIIPVVLSVGPAK
jgi:hypothetical protein